MDLNFSETEVQRYSRHILLREVGGTGQAKLKAAKVLVIGAGGLGAPLALYLTAAGIGTIGLVDHDIVELSNLQRQILFDEASIGHPKVIASQKKLLQINPLVTVNAYATSVTPENVAALVKDYDIVCDGTDNFATRFLVADACVAAEKILISGAVLRFEGQISTFKPHDGGPCYRCLYPEPPPEGLVPPCSEAGILGSVTGVMGTLMATEVIKEITQIGRSLSGFLVVWDALASEFRKIRLKKDPACPVCQ